MKEFIYVFTESDRDKLIAAGYMLLKSDNIKKTFVFKNNETINCSFAKDTVIFSDTLTF